MKWTAMDTDNQRFTDYERVLNAHETKNGQMQVSIRFPNLKYIEEFWSLTCASDLMETGAIPNAKELTEAMGLFSAASRFIHDGQDWEIYVVGDGSTPRLGALCAFRSRHTVCSIDPQLEGWTKKAHRKSIKRLVCYPLTLERFFDEREYVEFVKQNSNAGIRKKKMWLFPHTHINMTEAMKRIYPVSEHGDVLVTNSCCRDLRIAHEHSFRWSNSGWFLDQVRDDWGIHSPKRRVVVYRFISCKFS